MEAQGPPVIVMDFTGMIQAVWEVKFGSKVCS